MKHTPTSQLVAGATVLLLLSVLDSQLFTARGQGTAFTYQGQLQNNGSPASGTYNLQFSLYPAPASGAAISGPVTNNGVFVTNGLFTVTVDFGSAPWNGATNWLQIGVETNGTAGFATLSPRQQITPTPCAIFAEGANAAGISGTIPAANLGGTYSNAVNFDNGSDSFDGTFSGQFYGSSFIGGDFVGDFIGSGSGLTDVWHTGGNSGTTAGPNFVGTTDAQPLEMHVQGVRALRLEPDTTGEGAPNVIGGSPANFMDAGGVIGGFIGGGGALSFNGVGYTNRVSAYFGSIVGGYGNWIQSYGNGALIGGGYFNLVQDGAGLSVIGGGQNNLITASWAVIGGGYYNTNSGIVSFIGAGAYNNIQNAPYSAIGCGYYNTVLNGANNSAIGAGDFNTIQINADASFIGAGEYNTIQTNSTDSFIGGGYFNTIQTNDSDSFIGGGFTVTIQANAYQSFIGGGNYNTIQANAFQSVIAGGHANTIQTNAVNSSIGGGLQNSIGAPGAGPDWDVIGGGMNNVILGAASFIGGGEYNSVQGFADHCFIGGGYDNNITGFPGTQAYGTIGGGYYNTIQTNATFDVIGGGQQNAVQSGSGNATIGGGANNQIQTNSPDATIAGGQYNIIQTNSYASTIGGGYENVIQGAPIYAVIANTIAGGVGNVMQSSAYYYATISGGEDNTNAGPYSMIPGGFGNYTGSYYAFAAGNRAQALYQGDFVWADSQGAAFPATTSDQVSFRCQGGVRFTSGSSASDQTVSWTPGSASWSFPSDRNTKDRFAPVDPKAVLDKVSQLPVVEWSYKGYAQRHIGAMAQDFHGLFPLNDNDKTLNDADLHGVELAAIQGLNQKLKERDAEIQQLQQSVAELKSMVTQLAAQKQAGPDRRSN